MTVSITSQLNYFETISTKDIVHRIHKRSIDSFHSTSIHDPQSEPSIRRFKQIDIGAFDRKFHLMLSEKVGLLDNSFKAYSVDKRGRKKEIDFQADEFYEGNLIDSKRSDVTLHIDKRTNLMTGSIYDDDQKEAYFIEPYVNLAKTNGTSVENEDLMIIYRQKDMKDQNVHNRLNSDLNRQLNSTDFPSFCGSILINDTVNEQNVSSRVKRQSIDEEDFWLESKLENSRCSLRLVADYTFVEQMGNRDVTKTINFLVNLISEVDKIFRRTNWTFTETDTEPIVGYGFLVTEILIHEEMSTDLGPGIQHYNMRKKTWNVRDLLEAFSRVGTHKSFCLSHLFTHRRFDGGILGLAYVSSPRQHSYGGICSSPYYNDGGFLYLNTGLTTTKNSFDHRVLTRQAVLITAHELGHNFGSEHDPNTKECTPRSKDGGGFIMNTFSVSSYEANNQFFSKCSKRSIKAVLKMKAKDCFSKPKSTFCGNGIVERGEECDPGLTSPLGDQCCTRNCRLKAGSQCNDRNWPCCSGCKFSSPNRICLESNELDCKRESYCNGHSEKCPDPDALIDGTSCGDDGQCKGGECKSFCEEINFIPCMCENAENACRKCCKETFNSTCRPFLFPDGNHHHHTDGTICLRGYCYKGRCINVTSQDYIERFWSIIDDIEYNSFTMFLKDNLVFVVIFVSLILFLPVCWLIEQYDQKMKKKVENQKVDNRFKDYINKQHPSSVYGNQSSRTSNHQRRMLPRNRQYFSTNIPSTSQRIDVLDRSAVSIATNRNKQISQSNDSNYNRSVEDPVTKPQVSTLM